MSQPYRQVNDDQAVANATLAPLATAQLPPHLPLPWSDPGDGTRFWERDLVHFPQALTQLDFDYISRLVINGMRSAVVSFSAPVRLELRRFWTRLYSHDVFYCEPAEVGKVWSTTTRAAFAPVLADLDAYWHEVWLPEIHASQEAWAAFDLAAASNEALLAHLDDSFSRMKRLWDLHFQVVYAVGHAWEMFTELHGELFPEATKLEAAKLLQGFDNLTTAAGRGIWRLRPLATATPDLERLIATVDPAELYDLLVAAAETMPEATALLAGLRSYLADFGRRSTSLSLGTRTLSEDPTPVLSQLRDAVANPGADPDEHRDARIAERERAVADAKAALRHYPSVLRAEFERRLELAQVATRLKEDHNFIIDFQCTAALRAVIVELAGRMAAAGVIAEPDDVRHLGLDELRASGAALASHGPGSITPPAALGPGLDALDALDRRELVAARRAEMERYAAVEVPSTLGVPPGPAPTAPVEQDGEAAATPVDVIKGVGVSAGVARGRVRVANTFDAAREVRPGEVLVATSTTQPWTPLFATAAALVTEAGGVLSHIGVVAREYRLPAVSGVANATGRFRDGMLVEVDGAAGLVRIVPEVDGS